MAGKKNSNSKSNSNSAAAKQLQRQLEQQRKIQEQQRAAEQARLKAEIAKQQKELAERQRQMQQMLQQQLQRAEADRQRQLQKLMQQQRQIQEQAAQAQRRQMQHIEQQQRAARDLAAKQQRLKADAAGRGGRRTVSGDDEDEIDDRSEEAGDNAAAHRAKLRRATIRPPRRADRRHRHQRPQSPERPQRNNPLVTPAEKESASQASTVDSTPATDAGRRGQDARPRSAGSPGKAQFASRPDGRVEIAATQLTEDEIEQAVALGFEKTGESVLPRSKTAVQRLIAPAGMGSERARALLTEQMPLGKFVVNHTYRIFRDQDGEADDPMAGECVDESCTPASLINWQSALRTCTKDVKVGIIDTSFDLSHPAFRNLKVSSGQFLGDEQPSPHDWHGTAVLSLLAGDPQSDTPGLMPDAHFLLATAFKTDADGDASTDTVRLMAALEWLEMLNVQYVNMSFTGPRDPAIEGIIQRMRRKGVVFIAAAGNQGPVAPPSYPAAYTDVIAVTAVNGRSENYRHANRGDYIDVSAPGVNVLAALPDGKTGHRTGTSFATPFVTAIVATERAASAKRQNAVWKPELLSRLNIRDLGPPGRDPIYGHGLALAPSTCGGPDGSLMASGDGDGRQRLPRPMGAGGPRTINAASE